MNTFEKKLVDALRSGKYQQTSNVLRFDNSFCCLGVACDLYNPNLWLSYIGVYPPQELEYEYDARSDEDYESYIDQDKKTSKAFLPYDVVEALNWKSSAGALNVRIFDRDGTAYDNLTSLNDEGFSFSQIADFIEANFMAHSGDSDGTKETIPSIKT